MILVVMFYVKITTMANVVYPVYYEFWNFFKSYLSLCLVQATVSSKIAMNTLIFPPTHNNISCVVSLTFSPVC